MRKILLATFFANYFIGMKYNMPVLSVVLIITNGISLMALTLKELKKAKKNDD